MQNYPITAKTLSGIFKKYIFDPWLVESEDVELMDTEDWPYFLSKH